jgi:SAM-dependent MidA family methyltransferase
MTAAPLLPLLVERIRKRGPIPFAEFMEAALYHPVYGYYLKEPCPIGKAGDYVTAPDHHPSFSRLVGQRVRQVAASLGHPAEFTVVEMGAGTGALAEGILAGCLEVEGALLPVRYRIIEPFRLWRERQQERLARFSEGVDWTSDLTRCPPFTGVFVSNELADSFPCNRAVYREGVLRELHAGLHEDRLTWTEGDPSDPALEDYFTSLGIRPPDGRVVEVSLRLAPWARAVCACLVRGSFLTIDYGATAGELYGDPPSPSRPSGTLRGYTDHQAADPLVNPGLQDLTADVDFTTLIRACEEEGLRLHAFTTQRAFLLAMGWQEWLRKEPPKGSRRQALADLIDPRLMGRTRVLEMVR